MIHNVIKLVKQYKNHTLPATFVSYGVKADKESVIMFISSDVRRERTFKNVFLYLMTFSGCVSSIIRIF